MTRARLFAAGLAVAALVPSFANAQQTCEERRTNRIAGTVVGAGIGAILGSAVAGRGDRNEGAVIGGVGGALLGNQITKGSGSCVNAYGFYDNDGRWHSNSVRRADARGYYDRSGAWIEGAPPGRWGDDGRWVATDASRYGYNASYGGNDAPRDLRARYDWLEERVRRGRDDGSLSRNEANRALTDISNVRREERRLTRRGRLSERDMAYLQSRLDTVSSEIRWSRRN
jgi:uncharacterized protein YcfJ